MDIRTLVINTFYNMGLAPSVSVRRTVQGPVVSVTAISKGSETIAVHILNERLEAHVIDSKGRSVVGDAMHISALRDTIQALKDFAFLG